MATTDLTATRNEGVPPGSLARGQAARPERSVMDRAEQLAQAGSWDWNLNNDLLLWSDNMFRLFGLEPGEITPTPEYVVGRIHPEDREHVERELDLAKEKGTLPNVTYRITRPDGTLRTLRAFSAVGEERDGPTSRLIGSVQDITELAESERKTRESLTLLETLQSAASRVPHHPDQRDSRRSQRRPGGGPDRPHGCRGGAGPLGSDGLRLPRRP
jgi:PAS domain S-box-containing protein